jgi:8-oxo-dGTP diphosphatase
VSVVRLFLIRHAKAGSRQRWTGEDRVRPLSESGIRQAKSLLGVLEPFGAAKISRVLSSPYTRCVETVVPLADQLGLTVEAVDALAEGKGPEALALARHLLERGIGVALCSHGDVVPEVLSGLVEGLPDPLPNAKGSTWVVDWGVGRPTARYLSAPD